MRNKYKVLWFLLGSFSWIPVVFAFSCSSKSKSKIQIVPRNSGVLSFPEINKDINICFAVLDKDYFKNFEIDDFIIVDSNNNEIFPELRYSYKAQNLILLGFFGRLNNLKIKNKVNSDVISIDNDFLKTFRTPSKNNDLFLNLINDVSQNNIPLLMEINGASLAIQYSFFISLTNYFHSISEEHDLIIQQIHPGAWNNNKFNSEVLFQQGIWNKVSDIKDINQTNIGRFNLLSGFYFNKEGGLFDDKWNENFHQIINKFSLNNKKFDYVMTDIDFYEALVRLRDYNYVNNPLKHIFKFCNRVIIVSDGAIHTNVVVPELEKFFKNRPVPSRKTTIEKIQDYQKNDSFDELTFDLVLDLILLKNFEIINPNSNYNFINFVNYDNNIRNSLDISDGNVWTELFGSVNFFDYVNLIKHQEQKLIAEKVFSSLFVKEMKIENIIVSGFESFDFKKRNAIFLGSSLFEPLSGVMSLDNFSRLQKFSNLRESVRKTMRQLLSKFPSNEYNVIFKLHPKYGSKTDSNFEIAIAYIRYITDGLIENPIVIDPSIPIETLISYDFGLYKNKMRSFIFRENDYYKAYEWTTFFGLQATSTTVHTSRIFYEDAFGLSKEISAKLIPFSNFPIPTDFHLVNKPATDNINNKNYFDENVQQLKKIYGYFAPSIKYGKFNDNFLMYFDSIILNFYDNKKNV